MEAATADRDPHRQIAELEAEIDKLAEASEQCRKIIFAAKTAIGIGGVWLLGIVLGAASSDAISVFAALSAVLGGIVVFGSNTSTARQIADRIRTAEAQRAALISAMDLRLVPIDKSMR